MSKLNSTKRSNNDVAILDLSGKVQIGESSTDLRTALRRLVEEGERKILLNLAEVTHIDSCGLGEFVAGYTSLRRLGGELKLLNLTDRVSELMMITKLATVFDVFEDENEAVRSFQESNELVESARS